MMRLGFPLLLLCAFAVTVLGESSRIPRWILEEKFLRACGEANLETIKRFLKLGISPDTKDRFGQPCIHRVLRPETNKSFEGVAPTLIHLLDAGADINATNDFGSTALFLTTRPVPGLSEKGTPLAILAERRADLDHKDKWGQTYRDAWSGYDPDAMPRHDMVWRYLIEGNLRFRDIPPDLRPYRNSATFMMAVAYYGEAYQFSIMPRAPVEFDSNGESYLFYMASRTKFHSFELAFIDRQHAESRSASGETALIRASRFNNDLLVSKLLAAGVRTDVRDKEGLTALDYSVEYDQFLTTLALLSRADPNSAASGEAPIFRAIRNGNANAVAAFVHARVMIPTLAAAIKTDPLGKAAERKLAAALRRIDLDRRDALGRTPLIAAVEKGDHQIVQALLKAKVKTDIRDRSGNTALSIAKAAGNGEIVRLLTAK